MYRPKLAQQSSFTESIPEGDHHQQMEEDKVYQYILELTNPATREQALLELSKKREAYEDLAPILWYSFGILC
jgi:CCR4-NOT transcription complex subunit 9